MKMSQKGTRRVVHALSVAEKLKAIDRVHKGESKAAVARSIAVPESTLRGWCKSEHKLRAAATGQQSPIEATFAYDDEAPLDYTLDRTTPSPATTAVYNYSSAGETDSVKSSSCDIKRENWLNGPPPVSPIEAPTVENASNMFWKLYKNDAMMVDKTFSCNRDSANDVEDAVYYGEQFLRWLEGCSDPSITAFSVMQFRSLLKNVKDCAKRRLEGIKIGKPLRKRPGRK